MNLQAALEELNTLPPDAQRQVIDFIDFLKLRYLPVQNVNIKTEDAQQDLSAETLAPRLVKPFTPLKRDEIYDR